jgi:hypothetical protein
MTRHDAIIGAVAGLVTALTGNSTLGTLFGSLLGEMARFLIDFGPQITPGSTIEFFKALGKVLIATAASMISGGILKKLSGKAFSSNQIKNYF